MRSQGDIVHTRVELEELADREMPPEYAAVWKSLLLDAVNLLDAEPGDQVVGQLAGAPVLGLQSWPSWEPYGYLGLVASYDCGPVSALLPELGLPTSGRLAFFYYDSLGVDSPLVITSDPTTRPASRVIYVPESERGDTAPFPGEEVQRPGSPLKAVLGCTMPDIFHPRLEALEDVFSVDDAILLLEELESGAEGEPWVQLQIGGNPMQVQGPPEGEIAIAEFFADTGSAEGTYDIAEIERRTPGWVLLAQAWESSGFNFGDAGRGYWMIRPQDLSALNFDRAGFTWQSA
jgi:hypothetical protein